MPSNRDVWTNRTGTLTPVAKKKTTKRPVPGRHAHPKEGFHLPSDLREALIKYIEESKPKPSKSEVIRVALEEFLAKHGRWPAPKKE